MGNQQSVIPQDIVYKHMHLYHKIKQTSLFDIYANKHNLKDIIQIHYHTFQESQQPQKHQSNFCKTQKYFACMNDNLCENLEVYQLRKRSKDNIVRVWGIVGVERLQEGLCCSSKNVMRIAVEGMQYRLSQIQILTEYDLIVLLYNILLGYQQLQSKLPSQIQHFQLTGKMIGINRYGRTKIWYNQNFVKNYPSIIKTRNQQDYRVVEDILELIASVKISRWNANKWKNSIECGKLLKRLKSVEKIEECLEIIRSQYEKDGYIDFDNARIHTNLVNISLKSNILSGNSQQQTSTKNHLNLKLKSTSIKHLKLNKSHNLMRNKNSDIYY